MSLIKQLWIGIVVMLLFTLGGSFFISILSAKNYLNEQLRVKNIDNANSLALSISQMEKDLVTIEILISAQFDTGHYEYIQFKDSQDKVLVARQYDEKNESFGSNSPPKWFTDKIAFIAEPAVAQIQDQWQQFGTITVKSHSRYAWLALWQSAMQLLYWFLIASAVSGIVGTIVLKFISSPLDIVIQQAEAISDRRFVTTKEPKTTEFQRVVRAMNSLSNSVKLMLEKEIRQLEKLGREVQLDFLTELPNRNHFLNLLESKLSRNDSDSSGVIAIVRFLNLSQTNAQHGRATADRVLLQIAAVLYHFLNHYPNSQAGRLNGSDFMLVISSNPSTHTIGAELSEQLNAHLGEHYPFSVQLPVAICSFVTGDKYQELLHKLDGALAQAELKGNRALVLLESDSAPLAYKNLGDWRDSINRSLHTKKIKLGEFPVVKPSGEILHIEAPVRLELDEKWQPAGYFMPWAARLGLIASIDLAVIKTVLSKLNEALPTAINISADSLCNATFREEALKLISSSKTKMVNLWIEFPESCALRHLAELRAFANELRTLGCTVGLEHVGLEFTKISELQNIGLRYLKIDSAIIRNIDSNTGNQHFVTGMCKIGHSLGMLMIAEGVVTAAEKEKLSALNIDGLTGPGII